MASIEEIQVPIGNLLAEDIKRQQGEYGEPMPSMFGNEESEEVAVLQQCLDSEIDLQKLTELLRGMLHYLLPPSQRTMESPESLIAISTILDDIATKISDITDNPAAAAVLAIRASAGRVREKLQLLMQYLSLQL
jgi:hypothetical protein